MEAVPGRVERIADLEEEWQRLAEATGHPFATWEWNEAWWRRLGGERRLRLYACRRGERDAFAVLPLMEDRVGPVRALRFLGDGDLRGPVCAAADGEAAAQCLRAVLAERGTPSLLLAERLPGDAGWGAKVGGRLLKVNPDPVVSRDGRDWDEWLASRSRNFRQQLRRRERRLREDHGLVLRLCDEPRRLEADFQTLMRLHELRWHERSSGVFDGARGEFQREFAELAMRRGWLRLWIAELGGEPAAAWYGWRYAGSEWYYQAGRDPRFDDLSLGFVLLAHTVRAAFEDGVDAYRFLDGGEGYKWRFADADLEAETRLLAAGPLARLVAVGASPALRLRKLRRGGRR